MTIHLPVAGGWVWVWHSAAPETGRANKKQERERGREREREGNHELIGSKRQFVSQGLLLSQAQAGHEKAIQNPEVLRLVMIAS